MDHDIEAIFLDVGNTLRIVVPDEPFQAKARQALMALAETHESPDAFFAQMGMRWQAYRKWSADNMTEACERELWTRWLLPDLPAERVAPLAGKLTRLWRDRDGRRVARHDVKETVLELDRRGYTLGIIANTITETEIPDWLAADGLAPYFKAVILSSKVAYRKPGPEIYLLATGQTGVEPARSAYVGDNPNRDVEGARRAGFGMVIVLYEPATLKKEPLTDKNPPDRLIHEFGELLQIFPPRGTGA